MTRLNNKQRLKVNTNLATNPITNGNARNITLNQALWMVDSAISDGTDGKFCLDQQSMDSFLPPKATRQLAVIDRETGDHYGTINFSYEKEVSFKGSLEVVAYYAG